MRALRTALIVLAITAIVPGWLRAADSREYEVKAAFLFNFAKFVEWPQASFSGPQAPLAICVMGRDPFGATLDDLVRGEQVNDRPLGVKRIESPAEAGSCHILFVSPSERGRFGGVLGAMDTTRTLTVGDAPGFLQAGGHVRFFVEGNRVRFEIDADKTDVAQFKVSSKLMRVARVMRLGRPGS